MNTRCNAEEDAKCCSEQVKIIYLALHDTIHEIAERAFQRQGRDVTSHVVEIVSKSSTIIFLNHLSNILQKVSDLI